MSLIAYWVIFLKEIKSFGSIAVSASLRTSQSAKLEVPVCVETRLIPLLEKAIELTPPAVWRAPTLSLLLKSQRFTMPLAEPVASRMPSG